MSNTYYKEDVLAVLNKSKDNLPVYVLSSFNRWQISKIVKFNNQIVIYLGEVDNIEEVNSNEN